MRLFKGEDSKLLAGDPVGCGCTECQVGEYVPLNEASPAAIALLASDQLQNNTGIDSLEEILEVWKSGVDRKGYWGDNW